MTVLSSSLSSKSVGKLGLRWGTIISYCRPSPSHHWELVVMHRPAAEILPFLLVRLPIIAIESSRVVSPTIGAASTVMPLLDVETTGIASIPIRERLHRVGKCSGTIAVWNCR